MRPWPQTIHTTYSSNGLGKPITVKLWICDDYGNMVETYTPKLIHTLR